MAQRRMSLSKQKCWKDRICDVYTVILWARRWKRRRTRGHWASEGTGVITGLGCCSVGGCEKFVIQNYVVILLPWIFTRQSQTGSSVFRSHVLQLDSTTALLTACLLSQLNESHGADLNLCVKTVAAICDVKVNTDRKRTSKGKKAGTPPSDYQLSSKI